MGLCNYAVIYKHRINVSNETCLFFISQEEELCWQVEWWSRVLVSLLRLQCQPDPSTDASSQPSDAFLPFWSLLLPWDENQDEAMSG
ncbi:rCG60994 [Rattus norvegicus]|uniref:RCG60994 n=1 Tax=Rattus norvegicus TaxID=10116 RepID=A6JKR1_RAT|nr:rCG60994 [Rattus norvegicus]